MKKFVFTLFILLLSVGVASAQSVASQRHRLAKQDVSGNVVTVNEESAATAAVSIVDNKVKPSKVSGYRVVIYFNNGQYAGDKAQSVLAGFRSKYPGINAYLVYESPYFKVSVGDCLSMEEAIILMNSINGDYPKAFPKREDITLGQLKSVRKEVVEAVDSVAHPTTAVIPTH
jgi:hypothetical protein